MRRFGASGALRPRHRATARGHPPPLPALRAAPGRAPARVVPGALGDSLASLSIITMTLVLVAVSLVQLLAVPFRTSIGHSIFRLAVVNPRGEPARTSKLLFRWAMVWLPLLLPLVLVALLRTTESTALISALILLLLWVAAAVYAVLHPNRGLQDRLADTWVVRR